MNASVKLLTCHDHWVAQGDELRTDFRNFVHFAFKEILRYEPSRLQYDVCDYLQNLPISEDGICRGQVQSLRGVGKSVLVGLFIVWLLYCNPDLKIGVICSTQKFSRRCIKFARTIMDSHELLYHLSPRKATDNKWSDFRRDMPDHADGFQCGAITTISTEDSVKAFAVNGTFTGIHPNIVVSDDCETPENSNTEEKRQALHEKLKEFEDLIVRYGATPTCQGAAIVLFLGTPQTEQSIYYEKLDTRYVVRRWPARYPDAGDPEQTKYLAPMLLKDLEDDPKLSGRPTHPERHGDDVLDVKMALHGPQRFALQYMLDPTLADADRYPLKLTNLMVYDATYDMAPTKLIWGTLNPCDRKRIPCVGIQGDSWYQPVQVDPEYVPYQKKVLYVDPAADGADAVGYCAAGAVNGYVYVLAAGGLAGQKGVDGTSDAVMEKLARIAATYDIKQIVVEKNFGGGMYAKLLRPIVARICGSVEVTEVNNSGQKEKRIIDTLRPLTQAKRLVVGTDVAKNEDLWYQYTRITTERGCLKNDDMVEALAGACASLVETVTLDPERVTEERRSAEKRAAALEFQENIRRGVSKDGQTRYSLAGTPPSIDEQLAERDRLLARGRTRGAWRPSSRRGTSGWGGA